MELQAEGATTNMWPPSLKRSENLSKKHGKFDGIQICGGNFQTSPAHTQTDIWFGIAVEIRTSGQRQIILHGDGAEFSAFMLIVGGVETLQS